MEETWSPDPLLDEVEGARLEILAEHGNDHRKVWAHYVEGEERYADRLIKADRNGKSTA